MGGGMKALFAVVAVLVFAHAVEADAADWFDWRWNSFSDACDDDCSIMIFGGRFVETSMDDIFLGGNLSPTEWEYGDSSFLGVALSRTVASFWDDRFTIEPEVGFGKRFGAMNEFEAWAALFLRYHDFPCARATIAGTVYSTILLRKSPSRCHRTNLTSWLSDTITAQAHMK